jgi:hypothetical protein
MDEKLLVLTEKALSLISVEPSKDPGIFERKIGIVAMTEIGPNEKSAREFEAEADRKAKFDVAQLLAESQERRDRMQLESQKEITQMQNAADIKKAAMSARHPTYRWIGTMGACTLVAVGCIFMIGKYPQSWEKILPAGGLVELLLLLAAVIQGKAPSK